MWFTDDLGVGCLFLLVKNKNKCLFSVFQGNTSSAVVKATSRNRIRPGSFTFPGVLQQSHTFRDGDGQSRPAQQPGPENGDKLQAFLSKREPHWWELQAAWSTRDTAGGARNSAARRLLWKGVKFVLGSAARPDGPALTSDSLNRSGKNPSRKEPTNMATEKKVMVSPPSMAQTSSCFSSVSGRDSFLIKERARASRRSPPLNSPRLST